MANHGKTETTDITFLGTSSAHPEIGGDTASFVINRRVLVDTGWHVTDNLRNLGIDPTSIHHIVFTHFHPDHYLSLPSLFYYILTRTRNLRQLKIIGPESDLELTVNRTIEFLWQGHKIVTAGRPELIPLGSGDSFEADDFRLDVTDSVHPVPGLCYRFTDKQTGVLFSFSGDTAYHEPLADFYRGSQLLIHEATLGPEAGNPDTNAQLHSGAEDAARIAKLAGVGQLLLVHGTRERAPACVEAAKRIFGEAVSWPVKGESVRLSR